MNPVIYNYRPGQKFDHPYIISSWVLSHQKSREAQDCIRVYRAEASRYILRLLADPDVSLRVASLPDDPDAIIGWAVYETMEPVVHYCYTRKEARRGQIAKTLLAEVIGVPFLEFSHKPNFQGITLPSNWTYNPYRIYKR